MSSLPLHANAVPSLRSRVIRAAGWLLAGNLSAQAIRLGSSLILTRLLMPDAFGLMAAVNTLYFGLLMFSDVGLWQCIVRSDRGDDARLLGTAWTIQLIRGVVLAMGVLLLAAVNRFGASLGWFAQGTVYADPQLPALLGVFSLAALVQGFESMRLATAQRDMNARQVVRLELATQVLTLLVTAVGAWATQSVWALLAGTLFAALLKSVLSHLMLPGPRVRACWDPQCAREIMGFGKWIFVSSILGFLALQGEKLVLGGLLGVAMFGVFSIASNLVQAVVGLYSALNGRVIFASLSLVQHQHDHRTMTRVYERMQQLADLALGLLSGSLLMAGHWVVHLLYDTRYDDAGWMLQCLGLGLLAMRYQVLEQLMFTLGHPGWVSANNALRTLGIVVFVPAGFALAGTPGAVWGAVASQFASWPLSLLFKYRQGLLSSASERWWPLGLATGLLGGWLVDSALRWTH